MASAKDMIVREATENDYEAVMAIDPNYFHGLDLLPDMYFKFLRDPKRTGFVLELDDQVVGFAVAYVTDDGYTAVGQVGRIRSDVQAKGLWSYLRDTIIAKAKERNPTIKNIAIASPHKIFMLKDIRRRSLPLAYLGTRPCFIIGLNPGTERISQQSLVSTVKSIDATTAKSVILHADNQWRLFPYRRIVIFYAPHRITPSNINIIVSTCDEILCTFDPNDNLGCSTISFGLSYQTKKGLRYDIEVYGADLQDALNHIDRHIQLSHKYHKTGGHYLWIFLPVCLPYDVVLEHVKRNFETEGKVIHSSVSIFEGPQLGQSKL